ncbi:hypothetical protein HDU99_001183, partial [Rhizoclosmatium hyalinum]
MLATYGQPKESQRLNQSNYSTNYLKWFEEVKKTLGNIGLPPGSALYKDTPATPDALPINSLVSFLSMDITHVSPARIYGTETSVVGGATLKTVKVPSFELEMKYNGIVANYETAKNRVWGVLKDFMDDILFTVFKSAAGPTQNINRGIDALKAHCQVSHQSNINAAKNTLQSLRLAPNKHPLILLQNIQSQILILADLGYPDTNNVSLVAEFNASAIANFFTGLPDDELARSMTALIHSKATKFPLDFAEVLTIVAADELGSRSRTAHKELFTSGPGRAFVAKETSLDLSKDEQIAVLTKALAATRMKPPTRTKDLTKLFVIGFPLGTTSEQLLDVFHGATGVDFAKSGNGKPIAFV